MNLMIGKMSNEEYIKLLTEAKGAAKKKGEVAKAAGTEAHKWCENMVNHEIDETYEISVMPESVEAIKAITAFIKWKGNNQIQWLGSEMLVASDKYKIAGTLDGLAIVNGIPTLIDFKTSSQLSSSALLQVAGYDLMLEEMGFAVRQYLILRLPKDGKEAETLTVNDRDEMKFFRETFLYQRQAHKFYVYATNKLKDENGRMKTVVSE